MKTSPIPESELTVPQPARKRPARPRKRASVADDPILEVGSPRVAPAQPDRPADLGRRRVRREVAGVALLLFAVFVAASLIASAMGDASAIVGVVGAALAAPIVWFFGWPAAALTPIAPLIGGLRRFERIPSNPDRRWMAFIAGVVVLLPIACGLALDIPAGAESGAAGLWGSLVATYTQQWFGSLGAWVLEVLLFCVLTVTTLAWNPVRVLLGRNERPVAAAPVAHAEPALDEAAGSGVELALEMAPPPEELPGIDESIVGEILNAGAPDAPAPIRTRAKRVKKSRAEASAEHDAEVVAAINADAAQIADDSAPSMDALPSPELLTPSPPHNADAGRRELDAMGLKLMEALRTFRVDGELAGRTTGPAVTQFEIEPAPGVKVRQFATLANDLALAMRAASIRVVAPIPGRGAVGIEVPNPSPEMVFFRELIESREFQHARAALPIVLGKDLEGKPIIADLAKMPHLLIAGATGSGKSVCVNTIITSLIYRHTPKTLRFLMVDPKMVELSVYNTLPHLRHKVITDNRDAASVLKWAVYEMQARYELLAANGCRNVQEFNKRVTEGTPLKQAKAADVGLDAVPYTGAILPYIVVIIDEMADLMMTVQNEVETPIAMLAQKARAIGIHLILATQRPSVNVITGLIKANFPSRIAFRVASQVDSRTIIDGAGAETLLGNGDMLFIPPGKSEPARAQGAYLSSDDTERLLGWYESQRAARRAAFAAQGLAAEEAIQAEDDILEAVRAREAMEAGPADGDGGDEAGERDKLFRESAEIVIQYQQGSTSLLQRRLKVGYGRAARIIDQLHTAGVLGPPDGSKPRDVLVGLDALDRICAK